MTAMVAMVVTSSPAVAEGKNSKEKDDKMIALATFTADITPPIGYPLCAGWYPPATKITDQLSAIGIILTGQGKPVVLCALDWAELSNRDHLRWREALAKAVGTTPDRVAVQCTHAHNAPWPDRDAQDLLDEAGFPNIIMKGTWCEDMRDRVAASAAEAVPGLQPCPHIEIGQAKVDKVACNRRIMGDNGRIKAIRWTKTTNAAVRAEPEGLIDPFLKTISFWSGDTKLAALHYYATHNTSFDGGGLVTSDFAGLSRNQRSEADGGVPHIYFNGCAGNVTAGKYNDGNPTNRPVLTKRVLDAMTASEKDTRRIALESWDWRVEPVKLPPRPDLKEDQLLAAMRADGASAVARSQAALKLTYLRRGDVPIPISCLELGGGVCLLNLPGESFIEYQLAAQAERPDGFVAVTSYGDLGTGYITLKQSFAEGGYEPKDSFVSGESEAILRAAISKVLQPGK